MIYVENLTKTFKQYKRQPGLIGGLKTIFSHEFEFIKAIDNISFNIQPGEIIGYIGANGAGKSTTIKIMTGIMVPTSGKCVINGVIPYEKRQENAKQIGVVFGQRTQLWWDLPIVETFSILKEIYDINDQAYRKRMEFLNEMLGLSNFLTTPVRNLSLGQRMRADLAAALIHNPKILYLDEPTIGLDIIVKEKIRQSIKEMNREFGTTIILTTHDLNDIEELCNRLIIIDQGRKVYDGSIQEIKNTYGYLRTIQIHIPYHVRLIDSNIVGKLQLSPAYFNTWSDGNSLFIQYNRNQVNVSDVMVNILAKVPVEDISIHETKIEDIVKNIYNGGIHNGNP